MCAAGCDGERRTTAAAVVIFGGIRYPIKIFFSPITMGNSGLGRKFNRLNVDERGRSMVKN